MAKDGNAGVTHCMGCFSFPFRVLPMRLLRFCSLGRENGGAPYFFGPFACLLACLLGLLLGLPVVTCPFAFPLAAALFSFWLCWFLWIWGGGGSYCARLRGVAASLGWSRGGFRTVGRGGEGTR